MTLLIDADILVYKAASGNQSEINWGDTTSVELDFQGAIEEILGKIQLYCRRLDVTDVTFSDAILCFGGKGNFRKEILPTYKGNRASKARPQLIGALREWCEQRFDCRSEPMLEGDDMLGLLWEPGDIVVSQDKDLKGVPCTLYNPNHPDQCAYDLDSYLADYWHMAQTLTGDTCDGYKGCPRVGIKRATKILDEATARSQFCGGEKVVRALWWEAVAAAYEAKGLTEADALVQARVARILRRGDYDFTTKKIKLWSPNVV